MTDTLTFETDISDFNILRCKYDTQKKKSNFKKSKSI